MWIVSDVIITVTSFTATFISNVGFGSSLTRFAELYVQIMDEKPHGCFAWLIRVKRSCNQRWAKFRNDLRKRFHRGRPGPQLGPTNLNNETGTMDIVITKVPHNEKSASPVRLSPHHIQIEEDGEQNDTILTGYINDIINKAKATLETEIRDAKIMNEQPTSDSMSMTSSIISQIAETAVVDSLTCLIQDANQSATRYIRPTTLSEFMGSYGIAVNFPKTDGMPVVSD